MIVAFILTMRTDFTNYLLGNQNFAKSAAPKFFKVYLKHTAR